MKPTTTPDGFPVILHPGYINKQRQKLATQSTMMAERGPFLWIGYDHHLAFDEVKTFIGLLQSWVDTGTFEGGAK